ncbi:MAG: hypothetical protein ACM3UN_05610 [Bacillota bacterium]
MGWTKIGQGWAWCVLVGVGNFADAAIGGVGLGIAAVALNWEEQQHAKMVCCCSSIDCTIKRRRVIFALFFFYPLTGRL